MDVKEKGGMMSDPIGVIDGDALLKKMRELRASHLTSMTMMDLYLRECRLPIQPPVEDPERMRRAKIEAAIRAFEERAEDFLTANGCDLKGDFADLLRWVLGQEQKTWTDKDFGLEPETKK